MDAEIEGKIEEFVGEDKPDKRSEAKNALSEAVYNKMVSMNLSTKKLTNPLKQMLREII